MGWRRGQALGQDLRERVLADAGRPARAVAARFGVSVSYVVKARRRLRDAGEASARPTAAQPGRAPARAALRSDPRRVGATAERDGGRVARLARGRARRRGRARGDVAHPRPPRPHARKKQVRAAEQDRADVAEARRERAAAQPGLDPARLVFLDETWAATNMARRYGRAPRGERALDAVPHGHWRTTTVVAALRAEGVTAPLVLDGAMNGPGFLAYVEQFLAPALRPGDVLIMDNLSSHKVAGVREAVEAAGASLLYLPPYSPDLNPIGMAFAKLKALLRAEADRTVEALWAAVGRALARFPPAECARYLARCGYGRSK